MVKSLIIVLLACAALAAADKQVCLQACSTRVLD
jgi:hypothetical protein